MSKSCQVDYQTRRDIALGGPALRERLGHTSIQVTLDLYSHVAPGLQESAAKRFDEMLLPNSHRSSIQA
jgi:integrase